MAAVTERQVGAALLSRLRVAALHRLAARRLHMSPRHATGGRQCIAFRCGKWDDNVAHPVDADDYVLSVQIFKKRKSRGDDMNSDPDRPCGIY